MYLKIQVKGKKPGFYKSLQNEILLGTLPSCDVMIVDQHVSKKHLKIFFEANEVLVQDNGSTNGSFLEDERLIPGKKKLLTSEFKLRLGSDVFVSLAKETDSKQWIEIKKKSGSASSGNNPNHEKTTVLSIEDFKAADALARQIKAEKLAEKRKQNHLKTKKDKKLMLKTLLFSALVLGLGLYLNKNWKFSDRKKETNITKAAKALSKQSSKLDLIE
jgi:hypothetical protein